jgi:hypothetical protein
MPFKFEGLKVWKASLDLGEKINQIVERFSIKRTLQLKLTDQKSC